MRLAFDKYEGLGNDFVLVEAENDGDVTSAAARAWCDRRRGIGADGVLVLLPANVDGVAARMRVVNADGSIAEMCGNGLRCAALHLAAKRGLERGEIVLQTGAGPRACAVERKGDEAIVLADMGVVRVLEETILHADDARVPVVRVDAGNPHAVTFRETTRAEFEAWGPRLCVAPEIPGGTNFEVARRSEGGLDVWVWERGAGATLACGTGACAVVAAARAKGIVDVDSIRVRLPGGELIVSHEPLSGRTTMRGSARRVFSGVVSGA